MHIQGKNSISFPTAIFLVLAVAFSACKGKKEHIGIDSELKKAPDIVDRLFKYAATQIAFDEALLTVEQREVLKKLVQAAKHMDNIFWRQAYHEGLSMKELLERSDDPFDKDYLDFLIINFGLFDRQDGNKPFLGTELKPPGAGFYPSDLTEKEFQDYIASHPEVRSRSRAPTRLSRGRARS